MAYAEVEGVRLYYEMVGGGHPVVFVHGHGLDSRMWHGQVDRVARSYTVVCYDLRGHGRSEAPPTGYSLAHYAQELHDLVGHLGLRRVSLVGLSMGGNIAIEYALNHPDSLATVVLVDTGLTGYGDEGQFNALMAKRRALVQREGVGEKFVRATMMSLSLKGVRWEPDTRALVKTMVRGCSGAAWLDTAVYPPLEPTQAERVHQIAAPALVMVGERDGKRFHSIAEVLTRRIAVVRKAVIPGAGHLPPLENAEAFNDVLIDFLGGAVGKALV